MVPSEENVTQDDVLDKWLEKCDEAVANGRPLEDLLPPDASPELADRLRRAYRLLCEINEHRAASTSAERKTPRDDKVQPLPRVELPGYDLLEPLGRGGMGIVFKARQHRTDRIVAIKMIRFGLHRDAELRDRFDREAKSLAQLQHPNIVQIFHVGEQDDFPYFVMEYVEGNNLARNLGGKPAAQRDAAKIMEQLARAIDAAHQRGILHRDLKPSNVLLSRDGTPKVSDFGLAKHLQHDSTQTASGAVLGTPSYMAPEQAAGKSREVGPRTDVYSLGAILYETLTGKAPFRGDTPAQTLRLVINQEPPPPRRFTPGIHADLEAICLKCLDKAPARRYGAALELADDLNRWLKGEPTQARPPRWPSRIWRRLRRHKVAVALFIAMVAALAVLYWRQPENPLPQIEADLRAGKPVTLIGQTGMPRWFRWTAGAKQAQASLSNDGVFSVHGWGNCMIELLPDPQVDRYRFTAEVRHERSRLPAYAGLYAAQAAYPVPDSESKFLVSVLMLYNDVQSITDLVNLKAMNLPVGKGNMARMFINQFFDAGGKPGADQDLLSDRVVFFEPFRPSGAILGVWRNLEITVEPERVAGTWEGASFKALERTEFIERAASGRKSLHEIRPQMPWLTSIPAEFKPRGALGIFFNNGSVSYRNVRVAPL